MIRKALILSTWFVLAVTFPALTPYFDIDLDTDIFNYLESQAELKPPVAPESIAALDLTGDVDTATAALDLTGHADTDTAALDLTGHADTATAALDLTGHVGTATAALDLTGHADTATAALDLTGHADTATAALDLTGHVDTATAALDLTGDVDMITILDLTGPADTATILDLTGDAETTTALDFIRNVESTTYIYLENMQTFESSTTVESNTPSFVEEATEEAMANVTGDYSEEHMTRGPENEADYPSAVTSTLLTTTFREDSELLNKPTIPS